MQSVSTTAGFAAVLCLLPTLLWGESAPDPKRVESPLQGQQTVQGPLSLPGSGSFSLLDPSRFSMSQSYSLGFTSDRKSGQMEGMYLNTIRYRFSRPLTLSLQIGYLRSSTLFGSRYGPATDRLVVPGFELRYQPTRSVLFTVRYQTWPLRSGSYAPWSRY